jgi:hypothetical protein
MLPMTLLFLILPAAIIFFGVRARIRDGGGRGAGICIRRVAVHRNDDGRQVSGADGLV